jgi:hypothetical protein
VDASPEQVLPLFLRARIHAKRRNFQAASRDLETMRTIIYSPESPEGQFHIVETFQMEFEMHIDRRRYRQAFNFVSKVAGRIPYFLENDLWRKLSQAILFDTSFHEPELRRWADQYKIAGKQ